MGAMVALRKLGKRFECVLCWRHHHTLLLLIQCFVPGRYAKDEHEARDKLVAESFPILLDLWRHLLSSPVRRTIRICFSSACGSLMHERLAYA
jgi:hypothetical protein